MSNGGRTICRSLEELGPALRRGDFDDVLVDRPKLPPKMPAGIRLNKLNRPFRVVGDVAKAVSYNEVWELYNAEQSRPAQQAFEPQEGQVEMNDDPKNPSTGTDPLQPDPFDRVKQLLTAHKVVALDYEDREELRGLQAELSVDQYQALRELLPSWKPVCQETEKEWEPWIRVSQIEKMKAGEFLIYNIKWPAYSPEGHQIRADRRTAAAATASDPSSAEPAASEPTASFVPEPPEPEAPAPEPASADTADVDEKRHTALRQRLVAARQTSGRTSEELKRQLDNPALQEKGASVQ